MPLPQNATPNPLDDYMANYGARLQSLLAGGARTFPADNPQAVPAGPPDSQLMPVEPGQPTGVPRSRMEAEGAAMEGGGASFGKLWEDMPAEARTQQVDDFEDSLKQGNSSIDQAYDELTRQLGQRPDGKLSREDKGRLLMEFGLNLMANSARGAYGNDLGGATGAAALKVFEGNRSRLEGKQSQWDKQRGDIEARRSEAKKDLALQSSLEVSRDRRAEGRDIRRERRERGTVAGTVTDPTGQVFGYTKGGTASRLVDEKGQPIRQRLPASALGGAGSSDFQRRYDRYVETYGHDDSGNALTGRALDEVKRKALDYASDPRNAAASDVELRTQAEKLANDFMRSNYQLYVDMSPEEVDDELARLTEERYQRLKSSAGRPASSLDRPPSGSLTFKDQKSLESAFNAGRVKSGDIVTVGGKRFKVQ